MVVKVKLVKGNLKKYGIQFGELEFEEESQYLDKKECIISRLHRKESNISELVYYLEELYQMDGLDENEKEIYERYRWGEVVSPHEWLYVYRKVNDLNYEQF